jgi:hypothetical protein
MRAAVKTALLAGKIGGEDSKEVAGWPINRIEEAVTPTADQRQGQGNSAAARPLPKKNLTFENDKSFRSDWMRSPSGRPSSLSRADRDLDQIRDTRRDGCLESWSRDTGVDKP